MEYLSNDSRRGENSEESLIYTSISDHHSNLDVLSRYSIQVSEDILSPVQREIKFPEKQGGFRDSITGIELTLGSKDHGALNTVQDVVAIPKKQGRFHFTETQPRSLSSSMALKKAGVVFISPTMYEPGGFALNNQEGQYFQLFQTHNASESSGFCDSEFWTRSVLQESHSYASIRHSVVALGALYKTLEETSDSPLGSLNESNYNYFTASAHYLFALQQYTKAIRQLREALASSEARLDRTILISIVLFTCFESFTGDHKSTISQIQSGLNLLGGRLQRSKQLVTHQHDEFIENELIEILPDWRSKPNTTIWPSISHIPTLSGSRRRMSSNQRHRHHHHHRHQHLISPMILSLHPTMKHRSSQISLLLPKKPVQRYSRYASV